MAYNSPSHKFGQIIGTLVEEVVISYLMPVAEHYSLFLDYNKPRKARNMKKDVRWTDINNNVHKLDIVMEKGGDENKIGSPCVFIEIAWRRYTKHSRNKAQEISGALKPLIEKYKCFAPFFGFIVIGVFTQAAIEQMKSEGFEVALISREIIERSFDVVGINASWEESAKPDVLQKKVDSFNLLSQYDVEKIKKELLKHLQVHLADFRAKLCEALERTVYTVRVTPVFGSASEFSSNQEACEFIAKMDEISGSSEFIRLEICVRYSNGDRIEAEYAVKDKAIAFLESISRL